MTFLAFVFLVFNSGCTVNARAKNYGGTMTITLPRGEKLENATWKDNACWYLVRPMRNDELAERHEFREKSSMGIIEGKIIFVESR